jgi:hypothetical protein
LLPVIFRSGQSFLDSLSEFSDGEVESFDRLSLISDPFDEDLVHVAECALLNVVIRRRSAACHFSASHFLL